MANTQFNQSLARQAGLDAALTEKKIFIDDFTLRQKFSIYNVEILNASIENLNPNDESILYFFRLNNCSKNYVETLTKNSLRNIILYVDIDKNEEDIQLIFLKYKSGNDKPFKLISLMNTVDLDILFERRKICDDCISTLSDIDLFDSIQKIELDGQTINPKELEESLKKLFENDKNKLSILTKDVQCGFNFTIFDVTNDKILVHINKGRLMCGQQIKGNIIKSIRNHKNVKIRSANINSVVTIKFAKSFIDKSFNKDEIIEYNSESPITRLISWCNKTNIILA